MHEIKIYGEIIPFEDAWIIENGGYCSLTHVQNQLKEAGGKDIKVRVNSVGGDCDTGFAIYAELRRYAKENNAKITTFGEARVASIATVIFLAGDTRILTEHTEPFVHNAWTYIEGDNKTLLRAAADLGKWNERIAEHYALHTDLTKEEALDLMKNETSITTEEALAMRFCTEIEQVLRPVALQKFNKQKSQIEMNKNPKTKSVLAKVMDFIKGLEVKNLMLTTADEVEIDFYELPEDGVVEEGVKARIDGADAEGPFVMKSGETYVFEAGVLMEIIPAEDDEDVAALQAEIDNLTSQLEAVTNASAKAIEAKDAEILSLKTSIQAKDAQIAKFKNVASTAPANEPSQKPSKSEPKAENRAAKAIAHLKELQNKK